MTTPIHAAGLQDRSNRDLLIFHPAGSFFAIAAIIAIALPWVWWLQLEEVRLTHARLGIFGFGGVAVSGYLLTAQKAWTARNAPIPALVLGALALGSRVTAFWFPGRIWVTLLGSLGIAFAILWPVVRAGRWDKLPVAAVPLALAAAEVALVGQFISAAVLPGAMVILILLVGGRVVPAFIAEDRRRSGHIARNLPWRWPSLGLFGSSFFLDGVLGALVLIAVALWVLYQVRGGFGAGPANRFLCFAYLGLVPVMLGMAATPAGLLIPRAELHLLTMGAMGPVILAIAARVAMRRPKDGQLVPRSCHWGALCLVFAATVARCVAEVAPRPEFWMIAAGVCWSTAWSLFLWAHLSMIGRPPAFPLLSAKRLG